MGLFKKSYDAVQVDNDLKERINQNRPDGLVINVRPYPENNSLTGSQHLLKTLYNTLDSKFFGFLDNSDVSTFEIWYDEGKIQFYYYVKDQDTRERFLKQLGAFFPDADVGVEPQSFPEIKEGEWVAGARFNLNRHYFAPIRSPTGVRGMDFDPYQPITNDMTAKADTRMVVQVALKPAPKGWTSTMTKDVGEYAESIRDKDQVSVWDGFGWKYDYVSPPKHMLDAAKDIASQKGKPGFYVNIRMLAIGPSEQQAINQCKSVGGIYEQTHEEVTEQTLVPRPCERSELLDLVDDMTLRKGRHMSQPKTPLATIPRKLKRSFRGGTFKTMIMTREEVAALAHIPDESIQNPQTDWNRLSIPGTIPADAPTYESVHGAAPSDNEEQPTEHLPPKDPEGIPDHDVPPEEMAAEAEAEGSDDEVSSEWDNSRDALGGSDPRNHFEEEETDVDSLLDESMDDPLDEFVE